MRKLNNLLNWSKLYLWNIIDSKYNVLLEFKRFDITSRKGNLANTFLLSIFFELSKSKKLIHKLIELIGRPLRGNFIRRDKIFAIFILQSLIFA